MTEQSKAERDNLLRKAYGTATTQLREKYKDEFVLLQQSAAQKLGLDWSPRKSKEQRDRDKLQKILSDNPGLKDELFAQVKAQMEQG
jgi:hypothetical protein